MIKILDIAFINVTILIFALQVPLGILEKDENITEQMIDIVQHLQQYVPRRKDGMLIPILLGGDAFSVERGEGVNRARLDAINQLDRLCLEI